MAKVKFDLTPLTAEALEETWVKKDAGGYVEREIIFELTPEAWEQLWNALPCTERWTWPLEPDGTPRDSEFMDLVMRRPVVFRRMPRDER